MSVATDAEASGIQLVGKLLEPSARVDPYSIYAEFRARGPVWIDELSSLVVTNYRDCEALLRDPRLSAERWRFFQAESGADPYPPDAPSSVRQPWFLSMDAPDHTRLRRLVSSAFTARAVARMEDSVAGLVDGFLDRVADGDTFDVVSGLAYPLPVTVICRMLGVPEADDGLFHRWSSQLTRLLDGFSRPEDGNGETPEWAAGMLDMHRYVNELVAERRRSPRGDDMISELIAAEDGGDALSHDELVTTIVLLLVAGHETTVNLIANGVLALLRNPVHLDALRADPGTASAVVEETLRYDPPVQLTVRVTKEEMSVGGVTVPENKLVMLVLAAAHRDPEANPDPDRFDPAREQVRHLGFGFGAHFCLGAPLARLEGRLALGAFARRVREPRLLADPPPYREHINLRGVSELRVAHSGVIR
ncbi:cytochrome P450 [Spongiactinospora sp. TRM90649]|uniref:cytochrome P450 n=1 Tax=Spongiactinospora sp. TRM90649 TaxID=3031114 RepID=UPI0023F80F09|nr:cytochrome P450 [Spongiactinospora sp. TRM90649]MDF5751426.1 cytochrome P450 [Spongiactinospora sp. TRM90649]